MRMALLLPPDVAWYRPPSDDSDNTGADDIVPLDTLVGGFYPTCIYDVCYPRVVVILNSSPELDVRILPDDEEWLVVFEVSVPAF